MGEIRIATNTWSIPPKITGGLDVHVWEISKALSSLEADLSVFYPGKESREEDFDVIPLDHDGGLGYNQVSELNEKIFERLKESGKYDIFHSQDWLGVEAGYRAKKYLEIPWVFSCHSLEWMRVGKGKENSKICEMEKLGIEKSDKVITVSDWMKQEIVGDYKVSESKVRVVRNGYRDLNDGDFSPRREFGMGENLFVLYLGRLSEQKGIRYLLYAAEKLLKENKGVNFVIGGKGPLKESLEKFSELLGIEESVIFPGFIPEERIGSYYSDADVFISPSISEPFGMTVLEAWNNQTKIISTPCGASETIKDNSDFIEVRRRSSKDIYNSLKSILERNRDSEVENNFSKANTWNEAAERTLKVYRDVLR